MSTTTGTPCVRVTSAGRYFAAVGGRNGRRYGPMRDTLEAAVADVEALRCGSVLTGSRSASASDTAWSDLPPARKAEVLRHLVDRFRRQVPALRGRDRTDAELAAEAALVWAGELVGEPARGAA